MSTIAENEERVVALMNLFQGIPTSTIEQAGKQRTEFTRLMLQVFLNPNDAGMLMMLKDELDEILNSVKEQVEYVPKPDLGGSD